MRWDRDWKNAALVAVAYAVLALAIWLTLIACREAYRRLPDASPAHGEPRRPQFWPRPTPPHGQAANAPLRASLCVCAGGHK